MVTSTSLTYTHSILHTLGQNVALILHDVLGAKVPLSGTIEKGSNTCHWKFVTSSLKNKEYNNYILYCSLHISSSSIFKQLLTLLFSSFLILIFQQGDFLLNLILISSFPIQVDSQRNFGLPWRLSKHFKISEERLYRRKGTLRENSVDPHEKSLRFSSRVKTDGKSNRLAEFLKLNAYEKVGYATNSFEILPRVHYHTSKAARNENSVRTSTTAVQSSQRVNKEYVFQDIVHTDRLNSYGR